MKGESLETLVNLLRYVKGEIKFDNQYLGGVYYREKNGLIISTGIGQLLETDKLPLPAWDLLPMNKYMPHNWHIMGETEHEDAKGRYGVISTSIGCPFNCSFCAISSLFGTKKVRFWDVKRVVEEIERLVYEYNIKYIKILDECFVLNKDYINEFCDLLSEKNLDINMWGYARVDTVSPELLKKLRKVGVRWLAYGIESADDETLKGVSKGQYTSNTTLQAMQWTKEADINIIANFMFGLPNDTIRTMDKTLELCKKINPEWINFYVTMCYPGSKDYFDSVKDGYNLSNEWIQYAQYSYECIPAGSKYLSPEEVLRYRDWAFNAFFENNDAYFKLVESKFGIAAVERIKNMTQNKLKRKLLGD